MISPSAPRFGRARRLTAAGIALLAAGCVDVPVPGTPPDGATVDGGFESAPDTRPPDAAPLDAQPPDSGRIDAAVDPADAGLEADAHPSGVQCPLPCPHPAQAAAYVAASRAEALLVLDDGSVLLALTLQPDDGLLDALDARGLAVETVPLPIPPDLPPPAREPPPEPQPRPLLVQLEPDLSAIRRLLVPEGPDIGPIVDLWRGPPAEANRPLFLVARHGEGLIRFGAAEAGRGYVVLGPYTPPDAGDAQPIPRATVIDAAHDYQDRPPGAALNSGFVGVDGAPDAPARSRARWFESDGRPLPREGLRHHFAGGAERPAFGLPPVDVDYSTLPLRAGDRCALWTSADEPGGPGVYLGPVADGNGEDRIGRRPLDAFAEGACPVPDPTPGLIMDPAPVGVHGWSIVPGRSAAVAGVAAATDGATFFGFDIGARRAERMLRIPAVAAYDRSGALRWFQRLRRDALDGQPVVAEHSQVVRGLALDEGADRPPSVIVMAEGRVGDDHPLWAGPAGDTGFQGLPLTGGGNSASGWLGRLDPADGALLAATWIYRVNALPAPERMRDGRLGCFIDETLSPGVPQPVQLDPGRIAVGPDGQIAVVGTGIGLENTPDALQQTDAPYGLNTSARFVRIYAPDLTHLLYATALGPLPADADGRLGLDLTIGDVAFTADGHLLVVGWQAVRDNDGGGVDDGAALPTVGVPSWADATWPADRRPADATRAFVLRLVPDPTCGP